MEGAQPDRVLGELVDLAIERRVNRGGDVAMDPIETPSSPVSDEDGRALAEKASVFLQQWLMLRVAIVVAKKRGSPERRLGEQYNQQVPCQRKSACQQRWQRKGEGEVREQRQREGQGWQRLAFLRQRLLLLERVAQKGLHHASVIITVFLISAPLFHEMDPNGVPSSVNGPWLQVGGGKVHLQTVHR